jgi:hypothetical protein
MVPNTEHPYTYATVAATTSTTPAESQRNGAGGPLQSDMVNPREHLTQEMAAYDQQPDKHTSASVVTQNIDQAADHARQHGVGPTTQYPTTLETDCATEERNE